MDNFTDIPYISNDKGCRKQRDGYYNKLQRWRKENFISMPIFFFLFGMGKNPTFLHVKIVLLNLIIFFVFQTYNLVLQFYSFRCSTHIVITTSQSRIVEQGQRKTNIYYAKYLSVLAKLPERPSKNYSQVCLRCSRSTTNQVPVRYHVVFLPNWNVAGCSRLD